MESFPSKCQSLFITAIQQSQRDVPMKTEHLRSQRDSVNLFTASKQPPFFTLQFESWKSEDSKRRSVPVISFLSPGWNLQVAFSTSVRSKLLCQPRLLYCYFIRAQAERRSRLLNCAMPITLSHQAPEDHEESWSWGATPLSPIVVLPSTGKLFIAHKWLENTGLQVRKPLKQVCSAHLPEYTWVNTKHNGASVFFCTETALGVLA